MNTSLRCGELATHYRSILRIRRARVGDLQSAGPPRSGICVSCFDFRLWVGLCYGGGLMMTARVPSKGDDERSKVTNILQVNRWRALNTPNISH